MTHSKRPYDKIFIYALQDPITKEIRYIGKSNRPKERLMNQCNEHANTYRCHWIQSIVSKGKKPIQIILEELDGDSDWQERERYWIQYGREIGWPLTNATSGGDGVPDLPPETRERMRLTWLGRKHKPESLEKMRKASTGVKHSEASKQKMHDLMVNRTFTPEWKDKISAANRKITSEQAEEIKRRLQRGEKNKDLAAEFRVHRTTLTKIKTGTYFNKYQMGQKCDAPNGQRTLFEAWS